MLSITLEVGKQALNPPASACLRVSCDSSAGY